VTHKIFNDIVLKIIKTNLIAAYISTPQQAPNFSSQYLKYYTIILRQPPTSSNSLLPSNWILKSDKPYEKHIMHLMCR